MTQIENQFYQEIKDSIKYRTDLFEQTVNNKGIDNDWMEEEEDCAYKILMDSNLSSEQIQAISKIIKYSTEGVIHSVLVSIDGGTGLSSQGKALELIDKKTGVPISEGALHENFVDVI